MESLKEKLDQEDWVDRLLDGYFNLWIGGEFVKPLRSVASRMPLSALKQLVDKEPILFAPDHSLIRTVLQAPYSGLAGRFIVYFSPDLLSQSQTCIEAAIAREFARLVLGLEISRSPRARERAFPDETAADELAESWGFKSLPELAKQ